MPAHAKHPLGQLSDEERAYLERVSRASSASAEAVTRAKLLLAVAAGAGYSQAARAVGRRSGDAVAALVKRFNTEGVEALRSGLITGQAASGILPDEQLSGEMATVKK